MDFVHKQDIVAGKIGQDGGQIAAALQHRPGGSDQIDPQFGGHDSGQGGLAQTGVAVEQHMVHGLPALARGAEVYPQIGPQLLLPDEVVQTLGPDAVVKGSRPENGGVAGKRTAPFISPSPGP